jgi:mycothiol synthase
MARHDGADLGCLLLADHPDQRIWELVYMGIVPEARGRGLGLALARQAQWRARQAGAERLVLAVDAANEPALRGYAAAGFITWDRRSVFLKLFP